MSPKDQNHFISLQIESATGNESYKCNESTEELTKRTPPFPLKNDYGTSKEKKEKEKKKTVFHITITKVVHVSFLHTTAFHSCSN